MRQIQRRQRVVAFFFLLGVLANAALITLAFTGVLAPFTFHVLVITIGLLLFGIIFGTMVFGLNVAQSRRMLQLARGNPQKLVPVTLPSQAAPVEDGAAIILDIQVKPNRLLRLWLICISGLLCLQLFALTSYLPNWKVAVILLGYVFLMLLLLVLGVMVDDAEKSYYRQTLTVDATGIMVQRGRDAARRVAWAEVLAIYQTTPGQAAATAGTFRIITRDIALAITPYPGSNLFSEKKAFGDGDDTASYEAKAQRLLVTMATRGAMPMQQPLSERNRQVYGITAEDALSMPIATVAMPTMNAIPVPLESPREFTVVMPLRNYSFTFAQIPFFVVFLLIEMVISIQYNVGALFLTTDWKLILLIFSGASLSFWLFLGPLTIIVDRAKFRVEFPKLVLDEMGMTTLVTRRVVRTVPWAEARAWVVQTLRAGKRRYRLYGNNIVLQWDEDDHLRIKGAGNRAERNAAYRQQMAMLHATIAERTGLALREEREAPRPIG